MSYIQILQYKNSVLQDKNVVLQAELIGLRTGLLELRKYLSSQKFQKDPTVQVSDVVIRLDEADTLAIMEKVMAEETGFVPRNNKGE